MASSKLFGNPLKQQRSTPVVELWYYRVVFVLIAIAYISSSWLTPVQNVREFILPRPWIALLPLAFVVLTFTVDLVKRLVNEFALLLFLLITIHTTFFLFKNNFNTHYEIGILTLILFSNLHILNVVYLILYNVIVLGVLEFILITGSSNAAVSPVFMFMSVVMVMLFSLSLQLYRIRQQRDQILREESLETVFENAPAALLLFNRKTFALINANIQARKLLNIRDNASSPLKSLFRLENFNDNELVKLAATNAFVNKPATTSHDQKVNLTFSIPENNDNLLLVSCEETGEIDNANNSVFNLDDITSALPGHFYVTDDSGKIIHRSTGTDTFISVNTATLADFFKTGSTDVISENGSVRLKPSVNDVLFFDVFHKVYGGENYFFWFAGKESRSIKEANEPVVSSLPFMNEEWCMIVVNKNNEILSANDTFINIVGYSQNELQSLQISQLIHPHDNSLWNEIYLTVMDDGEQVKSTLRFIHKDRESIYLKCYIALTANREISIIAEDITASMIVQKELTLTRANVSSVIENTRDIILSVDINHEITVVNSSFKNWFYQSNNKMLKPGDDFRSYLKEPAKSDWNEKHMQVLRGKKIVYTLDYTLDNSDKKTFEISLNPITGEDGIISGVSLFGRDVTERALYETEIIKAKEIAETATAAKSQFLATMSHEIRTPLNGIVGMLELLRMTPLREKQREYVSTLQLSSENMLNIINDVLDFSKIESDKMELENEPFELRKVIEETFDLLYYRALGKKLELFYNIDETIPAFVMGDSLRLKQVLVNLVGNAIKFTAKGHILINTQLVHTTGDSLEIRFSVKDTGAGISDEQKERLFKSFSQADVSTYRKYGGTGLGLTISTKLVALMGGVIEVESELGEGSEFYFTIQTKPAPVAASKGVRNNLRLLRGKKILIFSADTDFDMQISDLFNDWNILHHTVKNVDDAKAELTEEAAYDALIMDAQMQDYLLMAEELKEQIRLTTIPVFVFNANFSGGDVIYGNKLFEAVLPAGVDAIKISTVLIKAFIENAAAYAQGDDDSPLFNTALATKYPLSILIAEDNPINQTLAVTVMEKLGYVPDVADDGLKVLEKVKAKKYDLIFMDVQMPEKDGLETTMELRKDKAFDSTIIIAMTAFAMDGDKEKCLEAGMNDYTTKPIRIEGVQMIIERWAEKISSSKIISNNTSELVIDRQSINRLKALAPENDGAFVKSILDLFIKQMDKLVPETENYFLAADWDNMYKSAHKLKGSAVNVGAKLLANSCLIIEEKGKVSNITGLKTDIADLKNAAEKTKSELKSLGY